MSDESNVREPDRHRRDAPDAVLGGPAGPTAERVGLAVCPECRGSRWVKTFTPWGCPSCKPCPSCSKPTVVQRSLQ